MAEQRVERQTMKRRGILAAAGAVVAGIAAKQTAQPVRAVTDTGFLASPGGVIGFATTTTGYSFGVSAYGDINGAFGYSSTGNGVSGNTSTGNGVRANSTSGIGVYSTAGGNSAAVYATNTATGHGVYGRTADAGSVGVYGTTTNDFGDAIRGIASNVDGTGVRGTGYYGVNGTGGQYGVLGQAGNGASTIGVWGNAGAGAGTGVLGTSTSGTGVYGKSSTGYGVLGYSTGGSASLSGISTNANIPAFAGGNSVAGGLAASFSGTVYVNGMFVVADMTQKHGLLKHPDGSHRLMYTVEAPESWAEDFGTGTLAGGKAEVKLDPDFAALIHTEEYHVFLTEHGGHNGLHTTAKGATGFTVAAAAHVTKAAGIALDQAAGTFSWRAVAKPKSDKKVERLAKFVVPNVPLPDVSKLPKPPELPSVPKQP